MDTAVALAQAYLQLNGYLTVAEFPVLARTRAGIEQVTDVDLIALRFPAARPLATPDESTEPDPDLELRNDAMDLLICEVKEGKARVNPNLTRDQTLRAVLERVGCCPAHHVGHHVRALLRNGHAEMDHPGGVRCRARIAVFAGRAGNNKHAGLVIPLAHVARAARAFLLHHETALRSAQLSQPALAQLHLLGKLGVLGQQPPTELSTRESEHVWNH